MMFWLIASLVAWGAGVHALLWCVRRADDEPDLLLVALWPVVFLAAGAFWLFRWLRRAP